MAFTDCRSCIFCPRVYTPSVLLSPSPRRNGGTGNTFRVPYPHSGGFLAASSGVEQLCLDSRPDRPNGALEGNVRSIPSRSGGSTVPARGAAPPPMEAPVGIGRRRLCGGGYRVGLRHSKIP